MINLLIRNTDKGQSLFFTKTLGVNGKIHQYVLLALVTQIIV